MTTVKSFSSLTANLLQLSSYSFKLTHSLPLPVLEQDKDLWDELEMEANALTATDAPLWDKVQSGIPALTPDFDAEALSESLFGDSSGD